MKRADLEALGLTKEQIDAVIKTNGEDIENAKAVAKAENTSLQTEVDALKGQVADRDKQLEDLKKSTGDVESLKKQIETLQAENKTKDEAHKAEIRQLKIDAAVDSALTGASAKNVTAVKALLKDLDKAELQEDGTIKGLADQIAALQKSDAYLFDAKQTGKKQMKGATPGEAGNEDGDKGVDTSKMTYSELAAYMAEHPDAKID